MFQNKLLLRFDPVSIREATLRRSKSQIKKELSKGKSQAKNFAEKKSLSVATERIPADDDDEENLDDMLQRVNSKIEQLISTVPKSVPSTPQLKDYPCSPRMPSSPRHIESFQHFKANHSHLLAMEIEERVAELQLGLEGSLLPTQKAQSDSEPDPEDSPHLKMERNEIHSQFEMLMSECVELRKENELLKKELAGFKSKKKVAVMATQTDKVVPMRQFTAMTSAPVPNEFEESERSLTSPRSPSKKIETNLRGRSRSVKELRSLSPSEKAPTVSAAAVNSPEQTSPRSPTSARGRSRSAGAGLMSSRSQNTATWAFNSSETPSPPSPQSVAVITSSPTPTSIFAPSPKACISVPTTPVNSGVVRFESEPLANVISPFEEYVQYHKEPMEGGWREFYQPRSVHNLAIMLSARDQPQGSVKRMLSTGVPLSARDRSLSTGMRRPTCSW